MEENYKPMFVFREKQSSENDSGWRLFLGFESEGYSENSDNFGIYDPKKILKLGNSSSKLLVYKGIETVW
ncbi:DUF2185 domain-containing protein [Cellulophaga sp. L1A9]|uniref:immunity protein Imm33 domain-containing protein n=1 Tax=Cellulophaga sp. L1A9 TaxID=2686362 RepID=UPI0018EED9C4|nr:DUF2185 domain-containing protein [Cellulophaga sp. L1A9]